MAKISRDYASGNLNPRENLFVTGTIGAVNAEVIIDSDGASSFALDLRGTFNLTIEVSGTVDGTNWTAIPVKPLTGSAFGQYVASVAGSTAGVYMGAVGPYRKIRARCTAYTSGSATTYLSSSTAVLPPDAFDATTQIATATGAAGAAVTLTIAAPGAGLRQYITYLRISRIASALLTAAAAPVVVTTTNLPGSLAFSIQADAAAQGVIYSWQEDFAYPVQASAQNTAVTIVCPLTTGVIWRVTAGYQVRP